MMKFDLNRTLLILCLVLAASLCSKGQGLKSKLAIDSNYKEFPNPIRTDFEKWSVLKKNLLVSFADPQVRYKKETVPFNSVEKKWITKGWRGEKVHTQLLIWGKIDLEKVSFSIGDLKGKDGTVIVKENISSSFVRYVLSDTDEDGCDHGLPNKYDSTLVADPIDMVETIPLEKNSVRPVWLSVNIPRNCKPGKYIGKITVHADVDHVLQLEISVAEHLLPEPSTWQYHLDLWQYPAPIAAMHGVELWSDAHFKAMKPYYQTLAKAGQKVITANIIPQPWGLDHVHFEDPSLIRWTKKENGDWDYDFSLFDRYIEFVMECGISKQINCYSMLTWDGTYLFEDQASKNRGAVKLKTGSGEYIAFWKPMIVAFAKHLKEKNWFDRTVIAMDERPADELKSVIALLKQVDPNWKIAVASDTVLTEIEKDIFDYSLASYLNIDQNILESRKAEGKVTTFYTACMETAPAGYTFSPPAENTWLAWHAAASGFDGYLFWAFNSWVAEPLLDARWQRYPSGTLFQFYPGPRSSIRFEKLIAGIQDFEKINIIKATFVKKGQNAKLRKLGRILAQFKVENLKQTTAAAMLKKAYLFIERF